MIVLFPVTLLALPLASDPASTFHLGADLEPVRISIRDTAVAKKVDTVEVLLTKALIKKLSVAYPAADTALQLVGFERPEAMTTKKKSKQMTETIEQSDVAKAKIKEAGFTPAEFTKAMLALYSVWKIEATYTAMKEVGSRFGGNFTSSLDAQVRRQSDVWKENLKFVKENGDVLKEFKMPPPETGWEGMRNIMM